MIHGWVKLHRKLLSWGWYRDSETLHLFLHILLKANHTPGKWQGIDVCRGELITGRSALSAETGLSEQSLRTRLLRLKNSGEITIKTTSKYSIITVLNYNEYQSKEGEDQPADQPAINQQLTSNQPATNHKQEEEELKNEKKLPPLPPDGGTSEEEKEADDQQQLDQPKTADDDQAKEPEPPKCPHQKIIDLYHEILCPQLPRVKRWTESRGKHLKARWAETDESQTIEWWEEYFKTVKECPWLMGEVEPSSGGKRFMADIDWLINQTNMAKVLEGKYSQGGVQKSSFGAHHGAAAPPRTCPIGTTAFGIISTENGENDEQQ